MEPVHVALVVCSVFVFLLHVLVAALLGAFSKKKKEPKFKQTGYNPWTLVLTAHNYRDIQRVYWADELHATKCRMWQRFNDWLQAESRLDEKLEEAQKMREEAYQLQQKIQSERDEMLREAESQAASITSKAHEEAEKFTEEVQREAKEEADKAYPESKKLLAEATEAAAAIRAKAEEEAAELIKEAEKRGPEVEQEIADRLITLTKLSSMVAEKEKKQQELEEKINEREEESETLKTKLNYLTTAWDHHSEMPDPDQRVRKRWLVVCNRDDDAAIKVFRDNLPQFRISKPLPGVWCLDTCDSLPLTMSEFRKEHNDKLKSWQILYMELPMGHTVSCCGWLCNNMWPVVNSWNRPTI